MKRTLALAILCVSTAAHADSKAWTAAKKVIPANMEVVGGINAGTAHGSALYQSLLPMALAKAGDVSNQLDGIKADCGIDVIASIDSIAFGLDANEKNGTIVVAFRGTTRAKLEACAQKRAKAAQKAITITTSGGLTKYSGLGGTPDKEIYLRWLGADVVAVSTSPDDKDATVHATAGGVAGDHGLKGIGTVNTSASLWLVSNKTGDIPGLGGKMTGVYGSANVAAGSIAVDMHLGVDDPKLATDTAAKATAELATMGGGGLADLFKTVKVAAAGTEVLVTAQVPEKALMDLLANFGLHA